MTENTIVNSPKFKALTWQAQWLFFAALREGPRPCGVVDVWPERSAKLAPDTDAQLIIEQAHALDTGGVMFYDAETDEMMFPGYLTEVTAPNNARKVIAVVNSLQTVRSQKLAGLAVWELQQLRDTHPDAPVWNDPRAVAALARPSINPASLQGERAQP
jgi:hypothetical protein